MPNGIPFRHEYPSFPGLFHRINWRIVKAQPNIRVGDSSMKTIRFLILIAIVALLILAFLTGSPENPERQDAIDAFMEPLLDLHQKIEQSYPQLRGDLEQLKNQIRERLAGFDPKSLVPIHLPSTGSKWPTEFDSTPESGDSHPATDPTIQKEVRDLAEMLKDMSAEEMTRRVKDIYEKLQQYQPPPDASPTPVSP